MGKFSVEQSCPEFEREVEGVCGSVHTDFRCLQCY